jgi:hypothetical protein
MSVEAGLGERITAEFYADVLSDISGPTDSAPVTRIFVICIPCDVTVDGAKLC